MAYSLFDLEPYSVVESLGVYSLGVDYISFIANENVAFFDLVDYISFIALGVYSVGVYSGGSTISDNRFGI